MRTHLLKSLLVSWRYFWRRKVTVQYPEQQKFKAERFRGLPVHRSQADGTAKCIGCCQCQKICPAQAISVSKVEGNVVYTLNTGKCIYCGLCVACCPVQALQKSNAIYSAVQQREQLLLNLPQLLAMGQEEHTNDE